MTTVRDLLISFGTEVDRGSLSKSEAEVKKTATGMQNILEKALSVGFLVGIGKGAFALNKLASDVEENLNVINTSFGESAQDVIQWSKDFGAAAGRSQYELQKTAAGLGALLNPMLEGNAQAAAEMSKGLAQLSVDLGSFFNAADSDVLVALQSALAGSTEPMRRFGVNMTVAAMDAYALEKGIGKTVAKMSEAEKTQLRYEYILEKTTTAQGDAIKTADGWANASKAVSGALSEIATDIGLKLYPYMTKLAVGTRNILRAFKDWVSGTKLVESALIVLGVVATAVAIKLFIAFAPVLIPILKIAAVIALLVLAVDDFLTFLDGGGSVIGDFINWLYGPGSAEEAAQMLKDAWQALKILWIQDIVPAIEYLRDVFESWIKWIAETAIPAIQQFGSDTWKVISDIEAWFSELFTNIIEWADKAWGTLSDFAEKVGGVFKAAANFLGIEIPEVNVQQNVTQNQPGQEFGAFTPAKRYGPAVEGASYPNQYAPTNAPSGPSVFSPTTTNNSGGNVTQNITENVTVNNSGAAVAESATKMADRIADSVAKQHRRTLEALKQRKAAQ